MFKSHADLPMCKAIYSDQIASNVGAIMRLVTDPRRDMEKRADTIFQMSYDSLKPPKGHVGIHTIALGDFETYGFNRNFDGFPKAACDAYHTTFVKHGKVYVGHNNKDPKGAVGDIVASAYNKPMGRIELYNHVNEKKAEAQLHRLATEGTHPFSMGCSVPNDRCSICQTLRKNAADENQCSHIRDHFGETWLDGRVVGTMNDKPTWFDESFVVRPADRIAWSLKLACADKADSIKLAAELDLWVPDSVAKSSAGYAKRLDMLTKLAQFEQDIADRLRSTTNDGYTTYIRGLYSGAVTRLSDACLKKLGASTPSAAFGFLAKHGVILSPEDFFKYAMGDALDELKSDLPDILKDIRTGLFVRLLKTGAYKKVCSNSYFDVAQDAFGCYLDSCSLEKEAELSTDMVKTGSLLEQPTNDRVLNNILMGTVTKQPELNITGEQRSHPGAEAYAAYKLSALSSILDLHKRASAERLFILAAAQDLGYSA